MCLHFPSQHGLSCWLCFAALAYREDRATPILSSLEVSPQLQATWLWNIESQSKGELPVMFILLGDGQGDWLTLCVSVLASQARALDFLSELPSPAPAVCASFLPSIHIYSASREHCMPSWDIWLSLGDITQITKGNVEFRHARRHKEYPQRLGGYWTHSGSQTTWDGDGET